MSSAIARGVGHVAAHTLASSSSTVQCCTTGSTVSELGRGPGMPATSRHIVECSQGGISCNRGAMGVGHRSGSSDLSAANDLSDLRSSGWWNWNGSSSTSPHRHRHLYHHHHHRHHCIFDEHSHQYPKGQMRSTSCPRGPHVVYASGKKSSKKDKRGGGGGSETSKGFGSKAPSKGSSVDSGALLRRSEELYRAMLASMSYEDGEVREFVVCTRFKKDETRGDVSVNNQFHQENLSDWLPIAELALVSEEEASIAVPKALPFVCRELAECVGKGSASLKNIPRDRLEYAFEPADDFYRHVMEDLGGVSPFDQSSTSSTDENPYEVLGLPKTATKAEVKAAYRALAAVHHPDRNLGEQDLAEEQFKRVTKAYDKLKRSGLPGSAGLGSESSVSLYESLGGGSRLGLSNVIEIKSVPKDGEVPDSIVVAVRRLDADITAGVLMSLRTRANAVRTAMSSR